MLVLKNKQSLSTEEKKSTSTSSLSQILHMHAHFGSVLVKASKEHENNNDEIIGCFSGLLFVFEKMN
jgi:hypothetical protein